MSQELKLSRQQQMQFADRISQELERVTMSWDNVLRRWHQIAIRALDYASVADLKIAMDKYPLLFKEESHGINMNVVMILNNNLENMKPGNFGYSASQWVEIMDLNQQVAIRWQELHKPVYKKVYTEFQIMVNKPKMVIMQGEA